MDRKKNSYPYSLRHRINIKQERLLGYMQKLSYIFSCIYVALLSSCSNESRIINPAKPSIQIISSKTTNFDLKNSVQNDFYDCIDSVEVVLLETTEQSIIGSVSDIHIGADKLFVTDLFKAKTIRVFDKEGKYLYSIGRIGKGKGEYTQMSSVNITNNHVDICDLIGGKVCRYGINGDFIKEMTFPANVFISNFMEENDNSYILSYQTYEEQHPFRVEFVDSSFNSKGTAFPFTYVRESPVASVTPMDEGHYLVYYNLCDTIYDMSQQGIRPLYVLGFYGKGEVDKYISETADLDKNEFIKEWNSHKKDIIKNFYFYKMPSHLFAMYRHGSEIYYSIIDETDNIIHTTYGQDTKKETCSIPFFFTNTYQDYIVTPVSYTETSRLSDDAEKNILSKMSQDNIRKWKSINNNNDDNPGICLFHLKNCR